MVQPFVGALLGIGWVVWDWESPGGAKRYDGSTFSDLDVGHDAVIAERQSSVLRIRQKGYFKDDTRNRIFTFEYDLGVRVLDIRSKASALPYTPGRMTAAYFYPKGAMIPADGVTLGHSILDVNRVLYDLPGLGKWRWAWMRSTNGTQEFVDCQQAGSHSLCR